jgi:hypothetical protein
MILSSIEFVLLAAALTLCLAVIRVSSGTTEPCIMPFTANGRYRAIIAALNPIRSLQSSRKVERVTVDTGQNDLCKICVGGSLSHVDSILRNIHKSRSQRLRFAVE